MGCCISECRKTLFSGGTSEEILIQNAEKKLVFSKKKICELMICFEKVKFPLEYRFLRDLAKSLQIPMQGATGRFLARLASKGEITAKSLRFIAILLCKSSNIPIDFLIFHNDRKKYLRNIELLLKTAAFTLPLALEIYDISVAKYAEKLVWASDQLLSELSVMSVRQISASLDFLLFSSSEIRMSLYKKYKAKKVVFLMENPKKIIEKTVLNPVRSPVSDIEIVAFHLEVKKNRSFSMADERKSQSTLEDSSDKVNSDRVSITGFNSSLAGFSKKILVAQKNVHLKILNDSPRDIKYQTAGLDFLFTLKGMKSSTQIIDLTDNLKRKSTNLSPKNISK